jgi:hypothetical protein
VREFPWEGITDLRLQASALNVKISIHFKAAMAALSLWVVAPRSASPLSIT